MRRALITGISGQDGSYLAEQLLAKGYEVHGTVRGLARDAMSDGRLWRISPFQSRLHLHDAELEDYDSLTGVFSDSLPDECYHLAATSTIRHGATHERQTLRANIEGTHAILANVRALVPACRVFVATSSEIFGNARTGPQNERTPFNPRSAYGVSKAAAYWLVHHFREAHAIFAVGGILYNHESPRRGEQFVTRTVSMGVAKIVQGQAKELSLRTLDSARDWGHAEEYADAMYRSLQTETPSDYVVATGRTATVRDFCDAAFSSAGLDYRDHVVVATNQPSADEPVPLVGDATRARTELGWVAVRGYAELAAEMVAADVQRLTAT